MVATMHKTRHPWPMFSLDYRSSTVVVVRGRGSTSHAAGAHGQRRALLLGGRAQEPAPEEEKKMIKRS
jgi:hypothetical protein